MLGPDVVGYVLLEDNPLNVAQFIAGRVNERGFSISVVILLIIIRVLYLGCLGGTSSRGDPCSMDVTMCSFFPEKWSRSSFFDLENKAPEPVPIAKM